MEDDDAPLRDDSEITAARLERRFARLTAARRKAERQVEAERQQHALELAQTRGQLEALTRLMSGSVPALPDPPVHPTGPPQAEQYADYDTYQDARTDWRLEQRLAQDRQQAQHRAVQQQLMQREATFKEAHPDFDQVVRAGLAGKVSPVLQQALMLVPDGPAVAYALATQPDLVQRLNTLPPPLVLVELGRLSPAPPPPAPGLPTPASTASAPASPTPLPVPLVPLSGSSAGTPTGVWREGQDMNAFRAWRKRTSALPEWKERR